ncbi:hypothetical protein [Paraflavitalea pollutisoli]|uniref:hypothetical protein n=1 Tax=Paraflavitalea pollutisoli TaxID=3034143 RepID=UPI0023ED1F33|nr:hypothetical protein [Paraflavitalea sp. H1-2-19X]
MRNHRHLTLVAIALLVLATACDRDTVVKNSITYDKDILKVAVYVKVDGQVRKDYKREINVAGLPKEERDALGKQLLDSLKALPDN